MILKNRSIAFIFRVIKRNIIYRKFIAFGTTFFFWKVTLEVMTQYIRNPVILI